MNAAKPSAADQLSLLGDAPEPVWPPKPRRVREPSAVPARPDYPPAWDNDRPAKLRALERIEKWTVAECAFFLRCSTDHVYHLIYDGSIVAHNIARLPDSVPLYRIESNSVVRWEKSRTEGG